MLKKGIKTIIIYVVMLAIIVSSVVPFVYMFLMSFKSTINAYDFDFSLEKMSLVQYKKIFALNGFERYIFNSVYVAVVGVILTVYCVFTGRICICKIKF